KTHQPSPYTYRSHQYLKFLCLFAFGIAAFIVTYVLTADGAALAKSSLQGIVRNSTLAGMLVEMVRLALGLLLAALVLMGLSRTSLYERQLVRDSYVEPVRDFFQRYGKT